MTVEKKEIYRYKMLKTMADAFWGVEKKSEFRASLLNEGISIHTVNKYMNDEKNKKHAAFNKNIRSKITSSIEKKGYIVDPILLQESDFQKFKNNILSIKNRSTEINLGWKEENTLSPGYYNSYRYAFANTGGIACEVLHINSNRTFSYYFNVGGLVGGESEDSITHATGMVLSSKLGFLFIATHESTRPDSGGACRPRTLILGHETEDKTKNKYRFGILTSTSVTTKNPVAAITVITRNKTLSEINYKQYVRIRNISNFSGLYGHDMLEVLNNAECINGNIYEVNTDIRSNKLSNINR